MVIVKYEVNANRAEIEQCRLKSGSDSSTSLPQSITDKVLFYHVCM